MPWRDRAVAQWREATNKNYIYDNSPRDDESVHGDQYLAVPAVHLAVPNRARMFCTTAVHQAYPRAIRGKQKREDFATLMTEIGEDAWLIHRHENAFFQLSISDNQLMPDRAEFHPSISMVHGDRVWLDITHHYYFVHTDGKQYTAQQRSGHAVGVMVDWSDNRTATLLNLQVASLHRPESQGGHSGMRIGSLALVIWQERPSSYVSHGYTYHRHSISVTMTISHPDEREM